MGAEGCVRAGAAARVCTRTTKDIDLARADDEEAATEHLNAATTVDLGDFFDFEARRTPALDDAAGFHAVRYTVRADLASRRFEQFPVDVALSESSSSEVESLLAPGPWSSPKDPAPLLPIVALEQHVAEKLHAYTGTYGLERSGRAPGSRISSTSSLIGELAQLDANRLSRALVTTFEQRASQPLPDVVPPPPRSWTRPYAELAQGGWNRDGYRHRLYGRCRSAGPSSRIGCRRPLGPQCKALAMVRVSTFRSG